MSGTILITGDSGAIGSATAHSFLQSGWTVLGVDIVGRDRELGDSYVSRTADVANEDELQRAVGVLGEMPPLRHLVAVAGGALPEEPRAQDDLAAIEVSTFRDSLDRNLTSQFVTIKTALPWLTSDDTGDRSIALTSSFNALSTQGMPAYSAAKAGLIGMMNALVRPLGAQGIRINVVAPGTIRTPRTEQIWSHVPDHFERLGSAAALGRVGAPEDIASVFHALAVDMTHVTGQVLVVDGGQTSATPA